MWFTGLGFIGSPGGGELLILFALILLLFGPKKLPEAARLIGRALSELRRASQDFRDQVMQMGETKRPDARREQRPDPYSDEPNIHEETGNDERSAAEDGKRKDAGDELAG